MQEAAQRGRGDRTRSRPRNYDVILLDINLPGISGLETCRKIRMWSDVPIIVITVRDSEKDKVEALDAGADDYVAKPFGMPEMLARIRATLRRHPLHTEPSATHLRLGEVEIDFEARRVKTPTSHWRLDLKRVRSAFLFCGASEPADPAQRVAERGVGAGLRRRTRVSASFREPPAEKNRTFPESPEVSAERTLGGIPP